MKYIIIKHTCYKINYSKYLQIKNINYLLETLHFILKNIMKHI